MVIYQTNASWMCTCGEPRFHFWAWSATCVLEILTVHLQLKIVYTLVLMYFFTFGYCTSEHVHQELVHLYLSTFYFWILYLRTCTSGTCTLVLMYFLLLDIVPQNMHIRNLYTCTYVLFYFWILYLRTCIHQELVHEDEVFIMRNLYMKTCTSQELSMYEKKCLWRPQPFKESQFHTDSFTVSHHQIRSWSLLAEDWRGREGYNKDWKGHKKIWKRKVPWRLCSWHTWHRGFSVQTLFMALLWQQPKIFRLQRMASHCLQLTELQMLLMEEIWMHPFTQGFKKKWFAFALHSEHSLQGWQSPNWYLVTPWIVCCSVPTPWLLESCYGTWWCQNCLNSGLRSKGTQPSNNTLSNTRLGGEPMGCPWCFMVMKCQLLELAKSGPGHLCVFLIAPYLPMQWVVQWTTSSCIVGLSLRSFVCQVLHFFWVQWTLSFKIMQWSFQAMYMGVWPDTDWTGSMYHHSTPEGRKAGTPLAGGYLGVLLQLSGDLDYFHKWLGLPQSTTHSKPCALCKAQYSGTNSWLDNRPGSPWQNTILTAANWQSWWTTDCSLFKLPGMTSMSIALDLMHNFYLGWLQYFFGSVFWLLCFECLDLAPLSNLHTIWNFIKEVQQGDNSRHKYRHRLDKLSMFVKKTGFPKLKGRASDIRGLDKALFCLVGSNSWSLRTCSTSKWKPFWNFCLKSMTPWIISVPNTVFGKCHRNIGRISSKRLVLWHSCMCSFLSTTKSWESPSSTSLPRHTLLCIQFSWPRIYTHHWHGVSKASPWWRRCKQSLRAVWLGTNISMLAGCLLWNSDIFCI